MPIFSSKLKKDFISKIDKFFHDFDKNRTFTESRVKEREKYQDIGKKRDKAPEK